jgi:NADPH:quinone reductase-like Zn-dependent oxidoreductase
MGSITQAETAMANAEGMGGEATRGALMRAIVQDGYGSPDVLRAARVERPVPAAGEVLVRVRAAGVDRGTWHVMAGRPYAVRLALGVRRPRFPVAGMDGAGTVVAVGAGVTRFSAGDEVFGVLRGSFAEYAAARERTLAHKPAGIGFEQAAVVAVSGVTALQAVRDAGRVQAGRHVLVVGASGGVGTYAVQLAKAFGAEVTGVCSGAKADLVRSMGADHVIDYTESDFIEGGRRYDVILFINGTGSVSALRRALTPRGSLVIVGGEDGGSWLGLGRQLRALALSPFVRQRLTTFVAKQGHADLETLSALIQDGKVTPAVGAAYPLARVPDAVRDLEAGRARGKLVITV